MALLKSPLPPLGKGGIKICVAGSICYGFAMSYIGKVWRGWGGALGMIVSFASCLDKNSILYPVCKIAEGDFANIKERLSEFTNIDFSGVIFDNTDYHLTFHPTKDERRLWMEINSQPIKAEDLKPFWDCDAIVINFFTHQDFILSTIQETRENSNALLFLDIHQKTTWMDEDGFILRTRWEDWADWLKYVDILQASQYEFSLLFGGRPIEDLSRCIDLAKEILNIGVSQIIITLGSSGSLLILKDRRHIYIPATTHKAIDTIGCGDAFGAGYVVSILNGKSPTEALAWGNTVAGLNSTFLGYMRGITLQVIEEEIKKEYDIANLQSPYPLYKGENNC